MKHVMYTYLIMVLSLISFGLQGRSLAMINPAIRDSIELRNDIRRGITREWIDNRQIQGTREALRAQIIENLRAGNRPVTESTIADELNNYREWQINSMVDDAVKRLLSQERLRNLVQRFEQLQP